QTPAGDPRARMARDITDYLRSATVGKEDRNRVKAFQSQEHLKADGLYGPQTALAVASYNIVPVKPFYWPRTNADAAKKGYAEAMLIHAQSSGDPIQAALWKQASAKVLGRRTAATPITKTERIATGVPLVSYTPSELAQLPTGLAAIEQGF